MGCHSCTIKVNTAGASWLDAQGKLDLLPPQGTVFNDYNLAIEAAVAGLGVIVGRSALITEELRSGRLTAVDPFTIPKSTSLLSGRATASTASGCPDGLGLVGPRGISFRRFVGRDYAVERLTRLSSSPLSV